MASPHALPPFIAHCAELLAPLGEVRARRMFGGWGLYLDGLFMAIVVADRLYLKADFASQPRFAAAGCETFRHVGKDGTATTMSYWSAPADALDAADAMAPWARLAVQAALSARAARAGPGAEAGIKRPARATRPAATKPPSAKAERAAGRRG